MNHTPATWFAALALLLLLGLGALAWHERRRGKRLLHRLQHTRGSLAHVRAHLAARSQVDEQIRLAALSDPGSPLAQQATATVRAQLERDLPRVLDTRDGFELHLQPQYARDGAITGAELLARWQHPTLGAIPPDVFIPLARELGLLTRLTEAVLHLASHALKRLHRTRAPFPISLNVSPQTLADPCFVTTVHRFLDESRVPGTRLIFEITEDIRIADMPTVLQHIRALNERGVRFSMDDFGAGYANLNYLRQLPLYELKLDRGLVEDIPENPDGVSIIRMSLALARRLGLRVVAEGVERQVQADFLFQHRCDAIQGHLFAHPMPVSDWLKRCP